MRPIPRAFALIGRSPLGQVLHRGNDQTRGITFLLLSVFVFTLMDATAKYLGEFYAPAQVVWARYIGNLTVLALYYRHNFFPSLRSRQPMVQFGRALCQLASVSLFFTALQHIGIAEATAIMDMNPVLITLGAALFLGEPVGWRRWSAIGVGFLGVLLVIRPGLAGFQPVSLMALLAVFGLAARDLATRRIPPHIRSEQLAASAFFAVFLAGVVMALVVGQEFVMPTLRQWLVFLVCMGFGVGGYALLVAATRLGEASALAPYRYTRLVFALILAFVVFDERPDGLTLTGAAIIVASGCYMMWREAALRRRMLREAGFLTP